MKQNYNLQKAISVFHALFVSLDKEEKRQFVKEIMKEINVERSEELEFMFIGSEGFFKDESAEDAAYDNYPQDKITLK
ncbi:MAG: hypothetical protein SFU25_01320 [Candidatus Caenarcaniphilales bacterium]|nr:hypothetical protein [Candidatus Caenarcaniphilales bacterium]